MKKILIVATLMLLLPLFGCLQRQVKQLQSEHHRLQSLKESLENELLLAPDPLKVEEQLRNVDLKIRYIEYEILRRQHIEQ
ncbi:hypothetical protein SCALIN_C04_0385 [Candidatus Scalindua japonica]|uniref:Uncharacterized protein n=1 Tax=Candidatus Scalindua japonica TaxID=1284222 RepID=A0A286TVG8_9BACT|nr:hypothetical protein [Candidatus Scalindua japonica]GAX59897.1 hypothetical protein SCALIN_C04_0385 [Candidatus Scalindua japonica]